MPSAFSHCGQHACFFSRSSRTIRGRTAGGFNGPPLQVGCCKKAQCTGEVKCRKDALKLAEFSPTWHHQTNNWHKSNISNTSFSTLKHFFIRGKGQKYYIDMFSCESTQHLFILQQKWNVPNSSTYNMLFLTLVPAGRGADTTPWHFLRCMPNYEAERAEIMQSLWGIFCAAFGKKKNFDPVMSGHGAMTSQEVQGQTIFARNSGIWYIRRRYRGFLLLF